VSLPKVFVFAYMPPRLRTILVLVFLAGCIAGFAIAAAVGLVRVRCRADASKSTRIVAAGLIAASVQP
jgi:hypothetical protein